MAKIKFPKALYVMREEYCEGEVEWNAVESIDDITEVDAFVGQVDVGVYELVRVGKIIRTTTFT